MTIEIVAGVYGVMMSLAPIPLAAITTPGPSQTKAGRYIGWV